MPRHIVCLTFDFDTQSGFIARGMTTPTPLSRGEFGLIRRAAHPRLAQGARPARHLVHSGIHHRKSWRRLRGGGRAWSRSGAPQLGAGAAGAAEPGGGEADLIRANECIERLTGRNARGYRSPAWDLSENTIDLLAHGFVYDSSLMGGDYRPYRVRRGDKVALGKPFAFGEKTSLIEMPISWSLDDYPHFEFVRHPHGGAAGIATGTHRHGELDGRVPLHAGKRRVGGAHLHHASLCDRARLPDARIRAADREPESHGRNIHDHGGSGGGGPGENVFVAACPVLLFASP